MIAILCIDSQNGLMFNHRRQSRDRRVLEDVQQLCAEKPLMMNAYSSRLFLQQGFQHLTVLPDFLERAAPGDFCFIEGDSLIPFQDKLEQLILYCWNRVYPADVLFDPSLLHGLTLKETTEFSGSSHKIITRKVYKR